MQLGYHIHNHMQTFQLLLILTLSNETLYWILCGRQFNIKSKYSIGYLGILYYRYSVKGFEANRKLEKAVTSKGCQLCVEIRHAVITYDSMLWVD